ILQLHILDMGTVGKTKQTYVTPSTLYSKFANNFAIAIECTGKLIPIIADRLPTLALIIRCNIQVDICSLFKMLTKVISHIVKLLGCCYKIGIFLRSAAAIKNYIFKCVYRAANCTIRRKSFNGPVRCYCYWIGIQGTGSCW